MKCKESEVYKTGQTSHTTNTRKNVAFLKARNVSFISSIKLLVRCVLLERKGLHRVVSFESAISSVADATLARLGR